ncbi:MAG: hypothetical protein J3Q66DRAFT_407830 [Benniella sp.]|nr:MAG: hypothetical protein J3Q66DRAFT_407830 [Benniella sp.]
MRISSLSGSVAKYTITVLEQLGTDGDPEKQTSVKGFLEDEQHQHQVFLLLGDSGAEKSTFNKAL